MGKAHRFFFDENELGVGWNNDKKTSELNLNSTFSYLPGVHALVYSLSNVCISTVKRGFLPVCPSRVPRCVLTRAKTASSMGKN
jgi:hypothetical protein